MCYDMCLSSGALHFSGKSYPLYSYFCAKLLLVLLKIKGGHKLPHMNIWADGTCAGDHFAETQILVQARIFLLKIRTGTTDGQFLYLAC